MPSSSAPPVLSPSRPFRRIPSPPPRVSRPLLDPRILWGLDDDNSNETDDDNSNETDDDIAQPDVQPTPSSPLPPTSPLLLSPPLKSVTESSPPPLILDDSVGCVYPQEHTSMVSPSMEATSPNVVEVEPANKSVCQKLNSAGDVLVISENLNDVEIERLKAELEKSRAREQQLEQSVKKVEYLMSEKELKAEKELRAALKTAEDCSRIIDQKDLERKEVEARCSGLLSEKEELAMKVDSLKALEDQIRIMDAKESEFNELKSAHGKMVSSKQELPVEIDSLRSELHSLEGNQSLDRSQREMEICSELETVRKEKLESDKRKYQEIDALLSEKSRIEDLLESLRSDFASLQRERDELLMQNEQLRISLQESSEQIRGQREVEQQFERLNADIRLRDERIVRLHEQLSQKNTELGTFSNRLHTESSHFSDEIQRLQAETHQI
ncbi:hypothetical protein HK098_007138 [Nowakowskiella sp. JEL0407]|nr:hypothetical protein HK098_007138 [Nowakowskiella sp. JEL0407]